MIAVGLTLGAIGLADALRPAVPAARRWIVLAGVSVVVIAVGVLAGAPVAALIALAAGAAWVWLVPLGGRSRAGFWPAVGLAVLCGLGLAAGGRRPGDGLLTATWHLDSPVGPVSFDQLVLVLGVLVFLLESANSVVRVALAAEGVATAPGAVASGARGGEAAVQAAAVEGTALKGGRLIGPIERLIVLSLTLAGAYPLLAAFIAAKGIVRFPEISRDSDTGGRAEYFLIGSLVSWVQGLAGAFLVWWSFAAYGA